ncbi:MAG: hypothetical protein ACRD7E_22235 [Bryobacteraceae bacterium]
MNIQFVTAVCCYLAVSAQQMAVAGGGQPVTNEKTSVQWLRVQSLSPQVQVQVRRFDTPTVKGHFVSVDESTLTINARSGEVRIARSRIRQVRVRCASMRLKRGAIGAAIGAPSGIAIAVALGGASEAATALGALGARIGFGVGLIPHGYTKLYEAR